MKIVQEYRGIASAKLQEARSLVRLFAFDYDGTVYDGQDHAFPEVVDLTRRVLAKDRSIAIITARAASAMKVFVPAFGTLLAEYGGGGSIFIGTGNGTVLYELNKMGLRSVYDYGFTLHQILRVVECWKRICEVHALGIDDLHESGIATFIKFFCDDWTNYIPDEVLKACRPYGGKIFAESAKVTFVLPRNEVLRDKVIRSVERELGRRYIVVVGDKTFAHITRRLDEDGKAIAVKTILHLLGLEQTQVVTFGDMPTGNDRGLLSFPFSFTNSEGLFCKKNGMEKPPYILANMGLSPVGQVYGAVDVLLE